MSQARDFADSFSAVSTGRRNLIINGAMQVAQRGTSSTGQTSGGYKTVDRFRADHGGFTGSYTQDTNVPSGYGFSNSYKVEVTTAASSDAGTLRIDQRIEAQNLRNSGWDYTNSSSYITFSCWVKSSLAGTYYFVLRSDDGTAKQYTESFTVTANTWKKLEISILGDSGLTFNNDTGFGAFVTIFVDDTTSNTDSGTTLNGWQTYSSSSRSPDFSQKWTETLNATFHTTGWQLELGNSASPFEHRSYGEELALCQRYYCKSFPQGTAPVHDSGDFIYQQCRPYSSNFFAGIGTQFPVEMRASPTMTIWTGDVSANTNSGRVSYYDGTWKNTTVSIHAGSSSNGFYFDGQATSSIVLVQFNFEADAEL